MSSATISASNGAELVAALAAVNGDTGSDLVSVAQNITLTAGLPVLAMGAGGTLALQGAPHLLSRFAVGYDTVYGGGFTGGLLISTGAVSIADLTLTDFQGADSITGAGSALFIGASANVNLAGVTLAATGGGGGGTVFIETGAVLTVDRLTGESRIAGGGGLHVVNGLLLSTANSYAGGTTIDGGTSANPYGVFLEVADGASAGTGAISFMGNNAAVQFDGTVLPGNALGRIVPGDSIVLAGVAAAASGLLTIAPDHTVSFALQGGGTATLHVDPAANAGNSTWYVSNNPRGQAVITGDTHAAAGVVTVRGNAGAVSTVLFDSAVDAALSQGLLDPINAGVLAGAVLVIPPTYSVETLASGMSGMLLDDPYANNNWPLGFSTYVNSALGAVTVNGQASNGQLVLTGQSGLVFTAAAGTGTVIAGGGANMIGIPVGQGGQFVVTGNGNDTVLALGGNSTIRAGGGSNMVLLGTADNFVDSTGADMIVAGAGNATVDSQLGSQIWLGGGNCGQRPGVRRQRRAAVHRRHRQLHLAGQRRRRTDGDRGCGIGDRGGLRRDQFPGRQRRCNRRRLRRQHDGAWRCRDGTFSGRPGRAQHADRRLRDFGAVRQR